MPAGTLDAFTTRAGGTIDQGEDPRRLHHAGSTIGRGLHVGTIRAVVTRAAGSTIDGGEDLDAFTRRPAA